MAITPFARALAWRGRWRQDRSQEAVGGIYTCVDATGRRITSDRPIMSCIDREQREQQARKAEQARQRLEENRQSAEVQNRAIAGQQVERDKINQRFDEELAHLRQLWSRSSSPAR